MTNLDATRPKHSVSGDCGEAFSIPCSAASAAICSEVSQALKDIGTDRLVRIYSDAYQRVLERTAMT